MPDVGGGAVHRVEQRPGLPECRLGGTHRIHQSGLPSAHCLVGQIPSRADVTVGERQPLGGGGDIAGDRRHRRSVEFGMQLGQALLSRADPGGQFDVLLGEQIKPGRGVDHQIA
ncbi:Uncharacterised protein [Mycobacterium tuberculosis]|nr:Uncharacterised protein [Mycobacterium tuberculosis]